MIWEIVAIAEFIGILPLAGYACWLTYHLYDGPWVKYPKGSGWSGDE